VEFAGEALRTYSVLGVLMLTLLLASSPIAATSRSESSSPLPYQMVLPSGYYQPFQIDAPATPTTITISMSANTSLSTALMTTSQFNNFNNLGASITSSQFYQNSNALQYSTKVNEGVYFLVFYASGYSANVSYNIQTFPISPYINYPLTSPQPTGISTFGLNNKSGIVTPYTIESSDVVGVADIASMQAYNASAPAINDTVSGATLQMNSLLVVNELGGSQQVYWVQDTPDFVTSTLQVSWADNIWNASVSGFLSNSTITSQDGGYAYSFNNFGSTAYYYSFQSSNSSYSLPLKLALVESETIVSGVGVQVQMGVQVLGNGSAPSKAVNWFDTATIHDPAVQSASFYVSGNATAPDGLFYETELVFGGEGNGEATFFNQMSASLGLFYGNSTTAQQTAYPTYYTFGGNTGETADNLQVTYLTDGFASVSAGTPNYVYLGAASGSFSLPRAGTQVSLPTATATATSSQTASSGSNAPILTYAALGTLVVVILVVAVIMVTRRRGGPVPVPEAPSPMPQFGRYCHNCGNPVAPEASFCPNCGAPQSRDEPSPFGQGSNQ
jgi:thermopsin